MGPSRCRQPSAQTVYRLLEHTPLGGRAGVAGWADEGGRSSHRGRDRRRRRGLALGRARLGGGGRARGPARRPRHRPLGGAAHRDLRRPGGVCPGRGQPAVPGRAARGVRRPSAAVAPGPAVDRPGRRPRPAGGQGRSRRVRQHRGPPPGPGPLPRAGGRAEARGGRGRRLRARRYEHRCGRAAARLPAGRPPPGRRVAPGRRGHRHYRARRPSIPGRSARREDRRLPGRGGPRRGPLAGAGRRAALGLRRRGERGRGLV